MSKQGLLRPGLAEQPENAHVTAAADTESYPGRFLWQRFNKHVSCCCLRSKRHYSNSWRATCCDFGSSFFVRHGLLFEDREREVQYLSKHKHPGQRLPVAVMITLLALLTVLNIGYLVASFHLGAVNVSNPDGETTGYPLLNSSITLCWIGIVPASVGAWAAIRSRFRYENRGDYPLMATAAWCVIGAAPITLVGILLIVVGSAEFDACNKTFARQCGYASSLPILSAISVVFAVQKIVLVLNVVAARVFFAISAFNLVVLLGGLAYVLSDAIPWCVHEMHVCL